MVFFDKSERGDYQKNSWFIGNLAGKPANSDKNYAGKRFASSGLFDSNPVREASNPGALTWGVENHGVIQAQQDLESYSLSVWSGFLCAYLLLFCFIWVFLQNISKALGFCFFPHCKTEKILILKKGGMARLHTGGFSIPCLGENRFYLAERGNWPHFAQIIKLFIACNVRRFLNISMKMQMCWFYECVFSFWLAVSASCSNHFACCHSLWLYFTLFKVLINIIWVPFGVPNVPFLPTRLLSWDWILAIEIQAVEHWIPVCVTKYWLKRDFNELLSGVYWGTCLVLD